MVVSLTVTLKVLYFALTFCHYRSDQIRSDQIRSDQIRSDQYYIVVVNEREFKEAYKISIGRLSFNDPPRCLLHPILASTRDS